MGLYIQCEKLNEVDTYGILQEALNRGGNAEFIRKECTALFLLFLLNLWMVQTIWQGFVLS